MEDDKPLGFRPLSGGQGQRVSVARETPGHSGAESLCRVVLLARTLRADGAQRGVL